MSAAPALTAWEARMNPDASGHVPVLANELVEMASPGPGDTVIDCTFGAGGHARLFADRIGPEGTLVAIDRDPSAGPRFLEFAASARCRTRFIGTDFSEALAELGREGLEADVVYMDFGMSSLQLDAVERGFSYSHEAPLDMRMDPRQSLTAAEILNEWPESRIREILKTLGEERYAGGIAREIVARRPLRTTSDLVAAARSGMPQAARFGSAHPARRTFQALRIAVNGELDSIDAALPMAWDLLGTGGRFAAISFHSLEDRRVKRFLAELARGCTCPPEIPVCVCGHEPEAELVTRRPVVPGEDEIDRNPRSRSARLRVAVKLGEGVA